MKLKISFIILLFLFIFILSCKKENFQNSLINMPKGFVAVKGNFFSQGENPSGPNAVEIDPDSVAEKYGKFSEISLDKKNMIVKQGYHVRGQLCLDNFCIDGNDVSKFDDDKKIPRFYKKCTDLQQCTFEDINVGNASSSPKLVNLSPGNWYVDENPLPVNEQQDSWNDTFSASIIEGNPPQLSVTRTDVVGNPQSGWGQNLVLRLNKCLNPNVDIDNANDVKWNDSRGNCDYYKQNPEKCINAESFTPTTGHFKGISAKDACCVCKSSKKEIDGVNYEEVIYNHENKNNIPDLLCYRARSGYKIVVNGANTITANIDNINTDINVNGTYISNGSHNGGTLFKKDGTSDDYQIRYKLYNDKDAEDISPILDFNHGQWFIFYKDQIMFFLSTNQSNLKWIRTTPNEQTIEQQLDFNGIEKNDDDNELCISGQEFRILNGSKSINIKSSWDSYDDYIRPYNTQYGDGNNNSGIRDYVFYQKDNDVMGIGENKTKAITKDKDDIQRIETCSKHVSSKRNCLSGSITYQKLDDPNAQIVFEDKWIIRYGAANLYYNNNSSDLSFVPTTGWTYNKESFTTKWGDGRHYRGTQNRARNGRECQHWTSQHPNGHSRTPQNYPNFGLGNHNYCRNPDGEPDIWCYTKPHGRWDFCDANTIQVTLLTPYTPPAGDGDSDLKQVSISGHSVGDGRNINGNYREVKIRGHYCNDSGKSTTGADYGIEYILLPGKKDSNSLVNIDKYTHIHDHSHNNSPHLAI